MPEENVTDDCHSAFYLLQQEECWWLFAYTSVRSIMHAFLPLFVRMVDIKSDRLHCKVYIIKTGAQKNEKEKSSINGNWVWCMYEQIAIFYVNLNLSASADYQACWQNGAYLFCWQDEQRDKAEGKEGERRIWHCWLITLQANSWVFCLHLDSQGRLRWASLIRSSHCLLPTHTDTNTHACTHVITIRHQSCFWFDMKDDFSNYQRVCDDESQ